MVWRVSSPSTTTCPEVGRLILEEPEVWGLEAIGADGLLLRVTVKTAATEEGPVERALRERLVVAFEQAGISIGVPQRLVWNVDA